MHVRSIASYFAALLAAPICCSAQFLEGTTIASIILAEQSAINSSVECGRFYHGALPASILLQIFGNYTKEDSCINIARAFSSDSYDNNTLEYAASDDTLSACDPTFNVTCDRQVRAVGINHYSPTANYSQVQVDIFFDRGYELRQFNVTVFAGDACEEDAATPWYSWGGCQQDRRQESCQELPYSVRSLRLKRLTPAEVSSAQCMIGAERGAGVRVDKAGAAALLGGVIVAGLMAVV